MTDTKDIVLQIEVQAALPENRGVVFRTFIDRDCALDTLHALMDKLRDAVDRQIAFAEIAKWQDALLNEERLAALHARNVDIAIENHQRKWAEAGRRGEPKLSHSEEQEKKAAHANLAASRDNIAMAQKKLELYKHKVNGKVM